ncbi:ATP-binding cassette transporter [Clonorchis sinensis]|uniref:ATP-binding cassette transporter n=1 Tax=Clonorchis sinensis TaxID=79923 RepID=G7Y2I3_CLOSI|nr:ATP-binding cassette transporter [Clonorchis sinensis]
MPIHYLRRITIAQQYRSELAQQLSLVNQHCGGSGHVDEAWQNVKGAMLAAFSDVCPTSPIRPQDHWMSARSLSMIDARKAGNEYDGAHKFLKRQIVKSLRKDRKLWGISEAREMEKAFAKRAGDIPESNCHSAKRTGKSAVFHSELECRKFQNATPAQDQPILRVGARRSPLKDPE